jgi:hypothetical protein
MWIRIRIFAIAATLAFAVEGSIYTIEAFRRQAEIVVCDFFASCSTNFKLIPDEDCD